MLLCFLEHCNKGLDFKIVGECAKNIDTGEFIDILISPNKDDWQKRIKAIFPKILQTSQKNYKNHN